MLLYLCSKNKTQIINIYKLLKFNIKFRSHIIPTLIWKEAIVCVDQRIRKVSSSLSCLPDLEYDLRRLYSGLRQCQQ